MLVARAEPAADARLRELLPEARATGPALSELARRLDELRAAEPALDTSLAPAAGVASRLGGSLAAVERIDDLVTAVADVSAADASAAASAAELVRSWRTANC